VTATSSHVTSTSAPSLSIDTQLRLWAFRRGLWTAAGIVFGGLVLATTLTMFVLQASSLGATSSVERQERAVVALMTLGGAFAGSADPVLPAALTALVALTVAQVLSVAPTFLLIVARATGGLAAAWVLLSGLVFFHPGELDAAKFAGAVAVGVLCLALAMVVSEFNPFARKQRLRLVKANLRSAKRDLATLDLNSTRRVSATSAPAVAPSAAPPLSRHLIAAYSWLLLPGLSASVALWVAEGKPSSFLTAFLIGTIYAALPVTLLFAAGALTWIAQGFRRMRIVWAIVVLIVLGLWSWLAVITPPGTLALALWSALGAIALMAILTLLPQHVSIPLDHMMIGTQLLLATKAHTVQRIGRFREERRYVRKQLKRDMKAQTS
jgi:hypothetical protein